MSGDMIGPYRVLARLGEGGMGEVYRARDTRLDRDVAIKVLPPEFAADPDRLHRFEQEARAASALNHPNILTVYDVGTHEGAPFLVTELLDGESLRERLKSGPLAARKAIELAVQVCSGLAAAHEKGIVHRDLKPENLFITRDGHARILDFGLAKLRPAPQEAAAAPTVLHTTEPGTVMGTVAYMSPEQVRGQAVDHRSDLFAFGAVLYEMVTGRAAFARGTSADTMSAILKEEPPEPASVAPATPQPLARAILHCLEKQPEERFQAARDLAFDLQALSGISAASIAVPGRQAAGAWRRAAAMIAGLGVAAALFAAGYVLAVRLTVRQPTASGPMRFSVTVPAGGAVVADATSAAISPDGQRLLLTLVDPAGVPRLWIRRMDSLSAQPLPGTENALLPFWSPDSRFVAFFAAGKLRKIPADGGPVETICDAPTGRGGTWNKEGVIVFAPAVMGPLMRVSSDGGETVEAARPDSARGEAGLRFPCFLPDGKHFLYAGLPKRQEEVGVYVGDLASGESRRIMSAGSAPVYAEPGYLLFDRRDRLVAQRFDLKTLRPVGEIVALGDISPLTNSDGAPLLSASTNGVLARVSTVLPDTRLVWLDRAGRTLGTVPLPPASYAAPSLSPDGRRAIVTKANSPTSYDLWLVDLERAVATRLTTDGLVASVDATGVWSPDGRYAAYMYNRSGGYDVYQVPTSGAGQPEPLVSSDGVFKIPVAWSPDGKHLVFSQNDATGWDLWLLPLQGDRRPERYLLTRFNENYAEVSPDGHWLAFDSDETGTADTYVATFPRPGEKYRVSTLGGNRAKWAKDGRELVMWTTADVGTFSRGSVISVDVQTSPTFKAGAPRVLFTPRGDLMGLTATGDLKRFLAAVPVEGASPASVTVIVNWQAALKTR